jgi:hypothetical protein
MINFLRYIWARLTQPASGGLIQPGDFRVIYKDGSVTRYMSYGDACGYAEVFGGRVQWRGGCASSQ